MSVRAGFGFGCGLMLFFLMIPLFIFGGCGVALMNLPASKSPSSMPATTQSQQPPSDRQRIGTVAVEVVSVRLGTIDLLEGEQELKSKDEFLKVTLRITNHSQTKRVNAKSWSKTRVFESNAESMDEFGNAYGMAKTSFLVDVVGQQPAAFNIDPGDTVEDVLIFDKPIKSAKRLTLKLPGHFVGLSEGFHLACPISH